MTEVATTATAPDFTFRYLPARGTTGPGGAPSKDPIVLRATAHPLPHDKEGRWGQGADSLRVEGSFADAVKAAAQISLVGATRYPGIAAGGTAAVSQAGEGAWKVEYLKSLDPEPAGGRMISPPIDGGNLRWFIGERPSFTTARDDVAAVVGIGGMMTVADGASQAYEIVPREVLGATQRRRIDPIGTHAVDAWAGDAKVRVRGGHDIEPFQGHLRLEDAVSAAREASLGADKPAVGIWADHGFYGLSELQDDDHNPFAIEDGWHNHLPGLEPGAAPERFTFLKGGRPIGLVSIVDGDVVTMMPENPLAPREAAEARWYERYGRL